MLLLLFKAFCGVFSNKCHKYSRCTLADPEFQFRAGENLLSQHYVRKG